MTDFDSFSMKDMAKLKNVNEADALLNDMKDGSKEGEIKSEYKALKEVEDLKRMVEKQSCLIHAFWIMLKEKGATNEEFDKALTEASLLANRKDYKNVSSCPNCGKGLQKLENKLFTSKCYYCGLEVLNNPYKKNLRKNLFPTSPMLRQMLRNLRKPRTSSARALSPTMFQRT